MTRSSQVNRKEIKVSEEVVPAAKAEVLQTPEAQALADEVQAGISSNELALPIIKLTQGLSDEVKTGHTTAGNFVNAVTKEVLGDEFLFVYAGRYSGRFLRIKGQGSWSAGPEDIVPGSWPEQYAGQRFSELPDSEENFRAAVNKGERDWGSGPPISTTYNYVGFVLGTPQIPVRISLMRSSARTRFNVNTLLKLWPSPFAVSIKFGTAVKQNPEGESYIWTAEQGEPVPLDQQQAAVDLATQFNAAKVVELGDAEGDEPARRQREGGAVSVS
jgi:hypothetical protein